MTSPALQEALAKVDGGDVSVDAPEWSNQGGSVLAARTGVALLLFALVATVVWNVGDELPGEQRRDTVLNAFQEQAEQASAAAASALSTSREANKDLRTSREAVTALRQNPNATPRDLRAAQQQRARDRRERDEARRTYERRVEQRSAALGDVLSASPTSDVDLVRAIGVGGVALLALLGAGALLAPRRSQLLSVKRIFAPPAATLAAPAAGAAAVAAAPGAAGAPALPAAPRSGAGITQAEPALTQGVLAAAALAAGLFGIQELEGTAEILLNVALPLVPIIGALFTRARVAPKPNLTPEEQARLFAG